MLVITRPISVQIEQPETATIYIVMTMMIIDTTSLSFFLPIDFPSILSRVSRDQSVGGIQGVVKAIISLTMVANR